MFALVKLVFLSRLSRRSAPFLLLLALGAALAPAVYAQPKDAPNKRLEAIRAEMDKGQGLFIAGNYAGAAEVFEAGYASYPYSAFLFNAGVCYQKQNDVDRALAKFREYIKVDPQAPDLDKVTQRIAALEAAKAAAVTAAPAGEAGGGSDAGTGAGVPPLVLPSGDDQSSMKSLVVIETEPDGAPLRIYQRVEPNAQFTLGAANPGFKEIVATKAPANLTLDVGQYHVVVEKFRDFNASEADMTISPGHVHQLKANLSQGKFMAFLRVSSNMMGAHIWIDDKKKARSLWGNTPHGELVPGGTHDVLVEAPGFQPFLTSVDLEHGQQKELEVRLERLDYGVLRIDASAPVVSVRVDEQPKGVWRTGTQPLDVRLDAGEHRLTVEADGRKTFKGKVVVPRGQILPLHVKMIPKYPRGPAWTQAIIGAAFLGASIYAGVESNRLYDELKGDRQNGSLDGSDDRATRGKWFAIGADAGFIIAGTLGGLATYNFIKDPLPESSINEDKLLEFEDPLKTHPVAWLTPKQPIPRDVAAVEAGPHLELMPKASSTGGGLFLGGRF